MKAQCSDGGIRTLFCLLVICVKTLNAGIEEGANSTTELTIDSLGATTDATVNCSAPHQPSCKAVNTSSDSTTITCEATQPDSTESCRLRILTVDCGETIKKYVAAENYTVVVMTDLRPYTQYNCNIYDNNTANLTSDRVQVPFRTMALPPGKPSNLTADPSTTSFNITWGLPTVNLEGVIGYWVTVTSFGTFNESHYVAHECEPSGDQKNFTTYTTETYYVYEEALPDFQYRVSVLAVAETDNGTEDSSTVVNTLNAGSTAPRNVTIGPIEYNYTRNIVRHRNITWTIPCNTNGPGKYFTVRWIAYYKHTEATNHSGETRVPYSADTLDYNYVMENVSAYTDYSVFIFLVGADDTQGTHANVSFRTGINYPSSPNITIVNTASHNFTINWTYPLNNPGPILRYHINITALRPSYTYREGCRFPNGMVYYYNQSELFDRTFNFTEALPYYEYNVSVTAETDVGIGNSSAVNLTTASSTPDVATDINTTLILGSQNTNYNASVVTQFTPTCYLNGPNGGYYLQYYGRRSNYSDITQEVDCSDQECRFDLLPQYNYSYQIMSENDYFVSSSEEQTFVSPAGVPTISQNYTATIPAHAQGTTQAYVVFTKDDFDWSQGDIIYMAVIVSDKNVTGGEYGEWNSQNWTEPVSHLTSVYYQATPPWWNPFAEMDSVTYTIGNNTNCKNESHYCNRPLKAGTQYYVIVRAFTNRFYMNSWPIAIHTKKELNLHFILGMIFGLLITAVVLIAAFVLWKKGIIKIVTPVRRNKQQSENTDLSNFVEYCNYLGQHPEELKKQYADLCAESEQACSGMETVFAQKPENKRKNRYINILPYDHTRVKLRIDEDDEMCSDYINASYIKGYNDQIQYISTQGPLHSTCRDFWRMILQEEVRIIVMVARFVEGCKEKCYKYFPKKGENMLLGDDMEVRCCTELDFGIYRIRSLQVRKDLKQITVTHMQFLQWPDFGVPSDTQQILQFYQHFKQRWAYEGGYAVIHCSAGVGRTGTLIATDILLQAIKAGKTIDVYNTVLELRRQRVNMVQTERQYMFIYSLVKNIIEEPLNSEEYNDEHFYENIEVMAYRDNEEDEQIKEKDIQKINETEF